MKEKRLGRTLQKFLRRFKSVYQLQFFSLPKEVVLEVVDLKAYKVAKEVARNSCGRIELWGFYDFLLKAAENDEIRKKERAERRNKKVLRP